MTAVKRPQAVELSSGDVARIRPVRPGDERELSEE